MLWRVAKPPEDLVAGIRTREDLARFLDALKQPELSVEQWTFVAHLMLAGKHYQ